MYIHGGSGIQVPSLCQMGVRWMSMSVTMYVSGCQMCVSGCQCLSQCMTVGVRYMSVGVNVCKNVGGCLSLYKCLISESVSMYVNGCQMGVNDNVCQIGCR